MKRSLCVPHVEMFFLFRLVTETPHLIFSCYFSCNVLQIVLCFSFYCLNIFLNIVVFYNMSDAKIILLLFSSLTSNSTTAFVDPRSVQMKLVGLPALQCSVIKVS